MPHRAELTRGGCDAWLGLEVTPPAGGKQKGFAQGQIFPTPRRLGNGSTARRSEVVSCSQYFAAQLFPPGKVRQFSTKM
jgi:hypothetical protein